MNELLLELYSEEIPARMQPQAELGFKKLLETLFADNNIEYEALSVFSGPCRIVLHASGLPRKLPSQKIEIKGPKTNAPEKAIEGFCRSNNINKDDLVIEAINGQEVYFFKSTTAKIPLQDFLTSELPKLFKQYVWPKSMFWGESEINWVRPLKNILCLFAGKVVPLQYGHLTANNLSFGHKFINNNSFEVKNFDQYIAMLFEHDVVLDRDSRRQIIGLAVEKLSKEHDVKIKLDPQLLEEVIGLVEYPFVILGKMNEAFLQVPAEILTTSMKEHQKFFSVLDKQGDLAPYFFCVTNNHKGDIELITHGNEKVLHARLADAQYFYNEDLKMPLETMRAKTKKIIFHASLGSMFDKTERLAKICKLLGATDDIIKAATYAKTDLASQVVDEFTDLQGLMGGYYTAHHGYSKATADAIAQHYLPASPDDDVPLGEHAILALADKLDSLVGLFAAGERASGSKDPYALRRLALGIIRLIIQNKIPQTLSQLLKYTADNFDQIIDVKLLDEIQLFIAERFKHWLKQQNHNIKLLGNAKIDNILHCYENIQKIEKCFETNTGKLLAESYKRAANISNFSLKNKELPVDIALLTEALEQKLYTVIDNYVDNADNSLEQQLKSLEILSNSINEFLDNSLIKHEDKAIATNRIALLNKACSLYHDLCDFSVL